MKVDTVIGQAIYEHCENTKGFPNQDYIVALEKLKRVIEIIKKKEPSIMRLRLTESGEHYNKIMPTRKHLTQEEYDLLKEVLS